MIVTWCYIRVVGVAKRGTALANQLGMLEVAQKGEGGWGREGVLELLHVMKAGPEEEGQRGPAGEEKMEGGLLQD